jgi:hypothetical protein
MLIMGNKPTLLPTAFRKHENENDKVISGCESTNEEFGRRVNMTIGIVVRQGLEER